MLRDIIRPHDHVKVTLRILPEALERYVAVAALTPLPRRLARSPEQDPEIEEPGQLVLDALAEEQEAFDEDDPFALEMRLQRDQSGLQLVEEWTAEARRQGGVHTVVVLVVGSTLLGQVVGGLTASFQVDQGLSEPRQIERVGAVPVCHSGLVSRDGGIWLVEIIGVEEDDVCAR